MAEERKPEKLYGVDEVMKIAAASRGTVLRWIRKGALPAFKVAGGRAWKIRERDLTALTNGEPQDDGCS